VAEVHGVDGSEGRLVYGFDLRALGLSQKEQEQIQGMLRRMLLRGRYAHVRLQGERVAIFQVTRALDPASSGKLEDPHRDSYYHVTIGDVAPDDSWITWRARPLRPGPAQTWARLDMSGLGLSERSQQMLYMEMRSRGLYVSARPTVGGIPLLTQAFRPLGSPPLLGH
jgi:hypothetical protein